MQDPAYIIFIAFACIWILIGAAAVIALLKSNNEELGFGKWGLVVAVPIIVPFIFVLVYQIARPFIRQHFL